MELSGLTRQNCIGCFLQAALKNTWKLLIPLQKNTWKQL